MAFRYVVRSDDQWERRAQQSGSQFVHFFKDEFRQYTPAKGENCVRILPPSSLWKNAPHYGLDVNVHYQVGPDRGSIICLDAGVPQIGNSGHPCPICQDMARHLRANDKDMAKELRPRRRVLTFVINRKEEAQGPLLWGMPYTLDQQISMIARDPSTGKWTLIDRPDDGYDIYFYKEGEGIGTKYTGVQLAKRPSPVADRHLDWVDRNPLPNTLKFRDYDEIKRIYEGIARGEEEGGYERPPRDGYERPPRDYEQPSREETPPWQGQRTGDPEPDDVDEPPPEPTPPPTREEPEEPPPRAAVRRPRTPRGNGADESPPPRTATTSDAKSRADELRAQFLSKRGG